MTKKKKKPDINDLVGKTLAAAAEAREQERRDARVRLATAAAQQHAAQLAALYVNIPREQLDRFKTLAELAGMTLREYVLRALENYAADQALAGLSALKDDVPANVAGVDPQWPVRRLNAHALRLVALENRVDAIQRRIDLEWGPDTGMRPVRASDVLGNKDK